MAPKLPKNHCVAHHLFYDCGHPVGRTELQTCRFKAADPDHAPPNPQARFLTSECSQCKPLPATEENITQIVKRRKGAVKQVAALKFKRRNQAATNRQRKRRESRRAEVVTTHAEQGRQEEYDAEDEEEMEEAEEKERQVIMEAEEMLNGAMLLLEFAKEARVGIAQK